MPEENKETPKEEPKKEPEPKKEEPKKTQTFVPLTNPVTGEIQQFTPQETLEFAQYGINSLAKDQDDKKDDEPKKEESDRVEKLETKIKKMEDEAAEDKRSQKILNELNAVAEGFDITKNGTRLGKKIKVITLTRFNQNPRLNIKEIFTEEVADFMEMEKEKLEKEKDTEKVKQSISGTVRGSGMPVLDTEKKYTAEDLAGTASRTALRKFLEASRE